MRGVSRRTLLAGALASATLGRSPRKTMPLTTATAGTIMMLSENTVTETAVASLIQAQCAKAKAMSTLYAVPKKARGPICPSARRSSRSAAPKKIGTPPSSMIHAVYGPAGSATGYFCCSTAPSAQLTAAPSTSAEPSGAAPMPAKPSPSSSAMPAMPSASPASLAGASRSPSSHTESGMAIAGMV